MTFKTIFGAAIVLCIAVYLAWHRASGQQKIEDQNAAQEHQATTDDALAESALKQLWSADPGERSAAKEKLDQLGPKAIKPILRFLKNMESGSGPRFGVGDEKEDTEGLERYVRKPSIESMEKDVIEYFPASLRVKEYCYEILGRLKSQEVVHFLIEELLFGPVIHLGGGLPMTADIRALIRIGPDVVPKLLEYFQKVEYQITSRLKKEHYTEEEWRNILVGFGQVFRARAAMVFGEIGDARALPILESFLKTTSKDAEARWYVKEAIKKIKEKSKNGKQAER